MIDRKSRSKLNAFDWAQISYRFEIQQQMKATESGREKEKWNAISVKVNFIYTQTHTQTETKQQTHANIEKRNMLNK